MKQAFTTPRSGNARTRRARLSRPARGISLIEVLVAIALLTIGVLSVITLFPAGFLTLEIAANATNADRIGQRELEKLNSTNAGQMGIIASIYSNYVPGPPAIGTAPSSNPNTALNATMPNQPILLGQTADLNEYRLIKGETVRVPAAIVAPGGAIPTLSLYTPAFSPLVSPNNGTVAGQPPSGFAVHSLPWSRRLASSGGPTATPNYGDPSALLVTTMMQIPVYPLTSPVTYSTVSVASPQYLIDYTNHKIALPLASYEQKNVLLKITDGSGVTYHLTLTASAANSGLWFDLYSPPAGVQISPQDATSPALPATEPTIAWATGSDVLSRDFANVTGGGYAAGNYADTTKNSADPTGAERDPQGVDPYKYQMYLGDQTGTLPLANLGTIAFNPVGGAIKDANGRPLMAAIDYEVYDWHIISEDRTASSSAGASSPAIRLSLRSLYAQNANDTFSDNTKYTGLYYGVPRVNNLDVTVLNLQTGTVLTTAGANPQYGVNYPDGVVTILDTTQTNAPLRIFYRAREDWGVALSKAPANYVLTDYTANSATPNYGECQIDAANKKLYFPLADLDKSVLVSRLLDTTGKIYPDLGLQQLVRDAASGQARCVLDLSGTVSAPLAATATQTGTIQGATVQAQVIWKEQGIWKHREITSVIPPGTTQMAVQQ